MDAKENLLKLINACVDNKQFYNTNNKERIESYRYSKFLHATIKRDYYLVNYSENSGKMYDLDEFNVKLGGFEISKYTKNCELYSNLHITFDDLPLINISIKGNSVVTEISEFSIDEIVFSLKKSWKFWKEKKCVKVPAGKKIPFKIKETKTEYCYEITSGSIKENISIEEFEKIMEKYKENKVKFARLLDEEKIQERLEKYKV